MGFVDKAGQRRRLWLAGRRIYRSFSEKIWLRAMGRRLALLAFLPGALGARALGVVQLSKGRLLLLLPGAPLLLDLDQGAEHTRQFGAGLTIVGD
jgi:hypothetical protein